MSSPLYSFCIITDGKEPEKLNTQMDSIHALDCYHEVIVSGNPPVGGDQLPIFMPSVAVQGRLGALRNAACGAASGEILVVTDDDMLFKPDWMDGLKKYGDDWDVLSCRILNPDGTRYWDWKAHKDGKNWLLDYGDKDNPDQSLTGGVTIMKAWVWQKVKWDDERGFNQEEDVDFTNRLKAAGIRIAFNPYSTIVHDAPYTQVGIGVLRLEVERG